MQYDVESFSVNKVSLSMKFERFEGIIDWQKAMVLTVTICTLPKALAAKYAQC